jgi:N,N'-diacetyllegionaminate synthase
MVEAIDIAGRKIGRGQPCFIIAEAGVNHDGSFETACRLVDAATEAGADAVKFQTFKAERLATPDAPKADYQLQNEDTAESSYEMLQRLELSPQVHRDLMAHCQDQGIIFLSTPFDEESADFLFDQGVPAIKVPSGEITNLPFLTHTALKGKPLIVSTGMSSLGEVEAAVQTIEEASNHAFALLHCVSSYPADAGDVNLKAMDTLARAFGCPVGYSDHTLGIEVSLAAVALGACVIEKHITLDRGLLGPDHQASSEPVELAALVQGIRKVEASLGNGRKVAVASEKNTAAVTRKSLVAVRDIESGTRLTEGMIAAKRPGTGLPPSMRSLFVGSKVRVDVPAGAFLTMEMLA